MLDLFSSPAKPANVSYWAVEPLNSSCNLHNKVYLFKLSRLFTNDLYSLRHSIRPDSYSGTCDWNQWSMFHHSYKDCSCTHHHHALKIIPQHLQLNPGYDCRLRKRELHWWSLQETSGVAQQLWKCKSMQLAVENLNNIEALDTYMDLWKNFFRYTGIRINMEQHEFTTKQFMQHLLAFMSKTHYSA